MISQCFDDSEKILEGEFKVMIFSQSKNVGKQTFMVTSMFLTSPVSNESEKSILVFHNWVRKASLNCRGVNRLRIS